MKALTVRQPWASLIAAGVKTIETRSWSSEYRGPLAIHAGKHRPAHDEAVGDWYWDEVHYDGQIVYRYGPQVRPGVLGAVVATCTLTDVVPICDAVSPPNHWPHGDNPPQWVGVYAKSRSANRGAFLYRRPLVHGADGEYVTDQIPFGDFTPGRYAFLLTDITPCDPVPAKGRRGLWDWDGTP